jgi:ectoine hydroxylase-related dioxygenase (phytanoyl-CoA dioxygenase family)
MLNKDKYDLFWEQGYIHEKNFFNQNELNKFNDELREIILAYGDTHKNLLKSKDIYNQFLLKVSKKDKNIISCIYDTICYSQSFIRLHSNYKIQKFINYLFNKKVNSPLYSNLNRVRMDFPKDKTTLYDWHQEVFFTIPKSSMIQTWAPLINNTDKKNGTIRILPGSHKLGIPKQEMLKFKNRRMQIILNKKILNKFKPLDINAKVGDMIFFSGKLFHASGNNSSKKIRYSMVGMYHDLQNKNFLPPYLPKWKHRLMTQKKYFNLESKKW